MTVMIKKKKVKKNLPLILYVLIFVVTLLLSHWHVTIVNIIIREISLLTPLLNFLLDSIRLGIENFSDDSVTMFEFLATLILQSRILGDV